MAIGNHNLKNRRESNSHSVILRFVNVGTKRHFILTHFVVYSGLIKQQLCAVCPNQISRLSWTQGSTNFHGIRDQDV